MQGLPSWCTGSLKRFSEPLHKMIPLLSRPRGQAASTLRAVASRPGRRTTIRELAEYTGLSPAAVSYALRGMQVSAETERRVREAADGARLRGRPDRPRAGRRRDRGRRACSSAASADFWNQELVRAVQRELYERRAQHAGRRRRRRARPRARARAAAGRPARRRPRGRADRAGQRRLGVDRPGGRDGHDRRRAAGRERRRRGRLRQRARRAARASSTSARSATAASRCCRGRSRRSPDREAERAVAALGGRARARLPRRRRAPTRSTARARSRSSCCASDERPTAVLCLSDSIAYGVYAACAELGLSIPGDVAVAGFGDHPISRLLAPPLTSTVWDVERVAELATGFLLRRRSTPTARRRRCARSSRRVLAARASTGRGRPERAPRRPSVSGQVVGRQELLGHRRPRPACRSRPPCSSR